jgi:hypothetical protein
MIANGLVVDDRSKRAAEVAHMITSIALLDREVVARQPEWRSIIEFEIWLQRRQFFPSNRRAANDERQIADTESGVQLTLQPRILGSEIGIVG